MSLILPVVAETQFSGTLVQTVRGRDVHAFLEIRKDFSDWMKVQVDRARLREGRDFVIEVSPQKGENSPAQDCAVSDQGVSRGGRPRTEYHLTLDAAKHVGMMSGTERGYELREYFLECERKARAVAPAVPQTLPEALRLAADLAEKVEEQSRTIAALEPRSNALAAIADGEGTFCIRDAAKLLQMTEGDLRSYLVRERWIYKREADGRWIPHADRQQRGWLTIKIVPIEIGRGQRWNKPQARVTSAGLTILAERLSRPLPDSDVRHKFQVATAH